MFAQVIRGKVSDPAAMRAAMDRWNRELRPKAKGFLGSTAGVADDGRFVAVARFESEDAARANSAQPEQSAWWDETSKLFDGEPQFYDCPDVDLFLGGGTDEAGFVQTMVYKAKDVAALRELFKGFEGMESEMRALRPDMLGGVAAYAPDGTVFDTNYFSSEAEAREGEKIEDMPEAMKEMGEKMGELMPMDQIEYIDLRDPWLY